MNPNDAAAAALQGGAQPPQPTTPQPGAPQQGGGLKAVAEAYARCEQTKSCTPEDLQVLKAGLGPLTQMVQNIQKIVEMMSGQQQR